MRSDSNPILTASVNSAAGVMGKMISVQSIAVAVAATGMTRADESRLFRFTIKHSVLLMVVDGHHFDAVCLRLPGRGACRPRKRFPGGEGIRLCRGTAVRNGRQALCLAKRLSAVSRYDLETWIPRSPLRPPAGRFLPASSRPFRPRSAATVGVVVGGAILSPVFGRREENWLPAASLHELPEGRPTPGHHPRGALRRL